MLEKNLLVTVATELGNEPSEPFLRQLLLYILRGRVVVRHDCDRHFSDKNIGDDVEDGLCFSCAGRALNNRKLRSKRILDGLNLAEVRSKREDQRFAVRILPWLRFSIDISTQRPD